MYKKPQHRVTLLDVARHAGVSRATASLVVRDSPKVADKTKEKVLQSMLELGYVYDRVAANLRSHSSNTIGVIITDIGNTFFSQLLLGIHEELGGLGYTVLLGTTFDSLEEQNQIISTMLENRVDGIILCPVSSSSFETVERIKQLDIPIVLGIRELPNLTCDYVGLDYISGAYIAVKYLVEEKGHKRIAFIGGISGSSTWNERVEGYKRALGESLIAVDESLILTSKPTRDGGRDAVENIMAQQNPPTAIFCFSDLIAFGVIIGLREMGFAPGKDIDIVGFDNIPEAEISFPPLTTVSSYAKKTGTIAANLILKRINHSVDQKERIIIEPTLIRRKSS